MRNNHVFINLDVDESVFFLTELEFVKSRSYDIQYGALLARRLFPVDSSASPGAETISYDTWDLLGAAKIIHSYSNDIPNLEVSAIRTSRNIYSQAISFGYSIQDIRAAQYAGKPLNQRKADGCRRQMLSLENKIAFHGNDATKGVPGTDIPGFINNPNVNAVTIPDGASVLTTWVSKTPDEIIADVCLMASTIRDVTLGIEAPQTLLLPELQYAQIACTPRSPTSDTTILSFILASNPWVSEIIPTFELKDAAPVSAGYDSEDCMILYDRSPEKLTLEIPQDIEFMSPQESALYFTVPVHSRTAGVIIYYPKSISQGNGI
jgi:hypothetical protein